MLPVKWVGIEFVHLVYVVDVWLMKVPGVPKVPGVLRVLGVLGVLLISGLIIIQI